MAAPYSETVAYRERVIAAVTRTTGLPEVLPGVVPATTCLRYSHLALAVRSIGDAEAFYSKLGFVRVHDAASSSIVRVRHATNGLDLHLVQATDCGVEGNVLMDTPTVKYPGHTHASWCVPSVPAVKDFLASAGIELSGTRSSLAVFVRDPDRTTLELERNDGGDERAEAFTSRHVGDGKPLDHVGTRVRAPYDARLEWYARALGFTLKVMTYAANDDPLKNFSPWVTRTPAGCDVNFIINASTPAAEPGAPPSNVLISPSGALKPGILYPAFEVAVDARSVRDSLVAMGVDAVLDDDLGAPAGWMPASAVRLFAGGRTVLVRDPDGNVVRLVPSAVVPT